ncbi:MAG: hypothetical protein CM1200mP26_24040 [Acidimicrobiales bacterium]|nr:MAG: hypothetical protein CM1200mP26_24040 [Acidimicrobiales bacterium]
MHMYAEIARKEGATAEEVRDAMRVGILFSGGPRDRGGKRSSREIWSELRSKRITNQTLLIYLKSENRKIKELSGLLDGKKILVTGAARGIGFAIASAASKAGASVAINDLTVEMADKAVVSITKSGGEACAAPGDVSVRGGALEIVNRAANVLGGLDGLVNNAGIVRFGTVATTTDEDWDATLAVNFSAVFSPCVERHGPT